VLAQNADNITEMVGKLRWTDEFSGLDGMNAVLPQQWLLMANCFTPWWQRQEMLGHPVMTFWSLVRWALANSVISDAVWAPFKRLAEVGWTARVVPDSVDTWMQCTGPTWILSTQV